MPNSNIRVIPLGGLGAIGKNMLALEYANDIVVIDAGVLFPGADMPGIDFVIPDISYLTENHDRVRAILITHGHEDHIGALPYVLPELNVPVYASRLTHGLISVKLREHGILADSKLNVIEPHKPFAIGAFQVEFFRVCHSIPDAMGIAIDTPVGKVVHTGDFKIDHTPVDGSPTDFASLSKIASDGVLLLCSDSTYAEVPGYTPSEKVVGEAIDVAIRQADGRVMVATFASLISRIQLVIDAAVRHGRRVTVLGRSMVNNVKMATKMGYLKAPPGTIIPVSKMEEIPHDETVIIVTGAQGEPTSGLVRIANGEHQNVEIVPGDTIIISASPIPGNEILISRNIDKLYRLGAKVSYSKTALVHVHGHASREELKMMLNLIRPKFFLPVHGEYRHLVAHSEIAAESGIDPGKIFVLEDGDVLELSEEIGEVVTKVSSGYVFVDGRRQWDSDSEILHQRRRLASDGVVIVSVTVDERSRSLVGTPGVLSSGFIGVEEPGDLLERTAEMASRVLEHDLKDGLGFSKVRSRVEKAVSSFLYEGTRQRPVVLVQLEKV